MDPNAQNDQIGREISTAVVRAYREWFGRGPTKARAIAAENLVSCLLADGLTPAEEALANAGQLELVREVRFRLARAAEDSLRAAIERITGRRVVARLSAIDVEANMANETFVLSELSPPGKTAARAAGD